MLSEDLVIPFRGEGLYYFFPKSLVKKLGPAGSLA